MGKTTATAKRPRDEDEESLPEAPLKKKAKPAAPPSDSEDEDDYSSDGSDASSEGGGSGAGAAATVYLEGIPRDNTEEDIRKFLAGVGTILDVRAPKYQDSGRLLGYAHVDFSSLAEAQKAVTTKDGRYMGERFISVSLANSKDGNKAAAAPLRTRPAGCTTAFIKGLPYDMDEAALQAAVAEHGKVVSTRIVRWNHTGQSKGFGYVQFEHGFSADALMKASATGAGLKIGGRRVQVDFDTGAPRASFKTSSGRAFFRTDEAKAAGIKKQVGTGAPGGAGAPASAPASKPAGAPTVIRRPAKTDTRG